MRLRYTSLGSGSEGNGLVVEAIEGDAVRGRVLLDCGFGVRDAVRRLASREVDPASLDAILVTHEHADHAGGAFRLARRFGVRVVASHGTFTALERNLGADEFRDVTTQVICSHTPFDVDALRIHPYPVPHDAREPTQFVFEAGDRKLGVLTDAGSTTALMVRVLGGCDALVLECNHDVDMLAASDYPESLKRRIAGDYGHLSNEAAARLLGAIDRSRLQRVHAAHLSQQNNAPERVRAALSAVIDAAAPALHIATQDDGFDWFEV